MRNAKTYVPQLLCPQPTKESDQTAFFLRNALTLVPRNNLARYSITFIYFVFKAAQFFGASGIHLSRPFRITP